MDTSAPVAVGNGDGTGVKSDAGGTGVCIGCTRSRAGEVESLVCYRWIERAGRHVETAAVGDSDQARSWVLEVLDATDSLGGWVDMSSKHTSIANHTNMTGPLSDQECSRWSPTGGGWPAVQSRQYLSVLPSVSFSWGRLCTNSEWYKVGNGQFGADNLDSLVGGAQNTGTLRSVQIAHLRSNNGVEGEYMILVLFLSGILIQGSTNYKRWMFR